MWRELVSQLMINDQTCTTMFSASDSILARVPPCAMHRLSAVSQSVLSVKSCDEEFKNRNINVLNSHPETF